MAVWKGTAQLVGADGAVIGAGRAYLHLRQPEPVPQRVQGTLSLDWWEPAPVAAGAALALEDGPRLPLTLESDQLSGCIQGRVLRYTTDWPGR
jgi:hypothetical protein